MKTRRLLAGVAAAATLLGGVALGATTAVAAPTDAATITVRNAQAGHTYTAYKFATFDDAVDVNGTVNVDVTTAAGWDDVLKAAIDGASLTPATEYSTNYAAYVATLTTAQLRAFADQLDVTAMTAAATQAVDADGDVTLDVTEGWFIVTDDYVNADGDPVQAPKAIVASTLSGVAAGLAVNTPDGQKDITAVGAFNSKSEDRVTPTPDKKADGADAGSVNVGDVVDYTVETLVPAVAAGYDSYTVTFKDVASVGLSIDESSITVTDRDDPSATVDFTTSLVGDAANGTTTTVVVANGAQLAGRTLVLAYRATVTADALDTVTNSATVTNNTDVESTPDTVTLTTGKFDIQKVNKDGAGLDGVTFTVADANGTPVVFTKEADGKYVVAASQVADGTTYVDALTTATVEGVAGKLFVRGLADGTYTVTETATIDGYSSQFLARFTVTVADGTATINGDALGLVDPDAATVLNVRSVTELPLTGGAGVALFTVVGLLLAGAAAAVTVRSRSTRRALRA